LSLWHMHLQNQLNHTAAKKDHLAVVVDAVDAEEEAEVVEEEALTLLVEV